MQDLESSSSLLARENLYVVYRFWLKTHYIARSVDFDSSFSESLSRFAIDAEPPAPGTAPARASTNALLGERLCISC